MPEETIRIKMRKTVRPDLMFLTEPGTVLFKGEEYPAVSNKHGAISGVCENGKQLGVRPDEFEFIEAPDWVLKIWEEVKGSAC